MALNFKSFFFKNLSIFFISNDDNRFFDTSLNERIEFKLLISLFLILGIDRLTVIS